MKLLHEMPKSGQFVAVWNRDGKIWSDLLKIDERGNLFLYNTATSVFHAYDYGRDFYCGPDSIPRKVVFLVK